MTETAIAEHGLIGDLHTAALVSTDGSIDWFCCPRFDSPSVFGALLDDEKGGHFRIRPAEGAYTTKQLYFPDTAVLITRFLSEAASARWSTSCHPPGERRRGIHRLVRMVRRVRGEIASRSTSRRGSTTAARATAPDLTAPVRCSAPTS